MKLDQSTPAVGIRSGVPVRVQLGAGFAALIAVAAIVIGYGVWSVGALQAADTQVSRHAVPYLTGLSDASVAAKAAANDERGFLLTGDKKYTDEARGRRTVEKAGLAQATAAAVDATQRKAVDTIAAGLDAFNQSLDDEFTLYASDKAGAIKISTTRNRDLRKAYEASIDKAIAAAKSHVAAVSKATNKQASRTRLLLLVLLGLMVAVGATAAWLLGRMVIRPLSEGVDVVEAAAKGDLTGRVGDRGAREFRRLARATNEMLAETGRAVATIARSADTVSSTAVQLASASQEIAGATDGAAREAEQVSAAAAQVSTSVQAVATAAEEMGATIGEIAGSAANAAEVAGEAVRAADVARGTVAKLDESSAQIGNVVKTITAIAEQTNLLALNATIEAARAGDAGKGFAVVASEVKDLAQETARATEDIVQRVEAIQIDTTQAIEAIARISEVIGQINDHQATIASTVEEQSATTHEMTRSIGEAATGVNGIAGSITEVAGIVQATTSDTAQARQAATALADMGTELRGLVGRFRY